ncbi:MAG: hypothetical protein GC136_06300 [Alphaproteobacteria bacterium]|nr:hypothetical protein [Alphaproteobacteria bacterium]
MPNQDALRDTAMVMGDVAKANSIDLDAGQAAVAQMMLSALFAKAEPVTEGAFIEQYGRQYGGATAEDAYGALQTTGLIQCFAGSANAKVVSISDAGRDAIENGTVENVLTMRP